MASGLLGPAAMVATRARLAVLMCILFCTFGCKGAGGLFKVLFATAVIGSRVAVAAAPYIPKGTPAGEYADPGDAVTQPVAADYPLPQGCYVWPAPAGAMRAMSCHGRVVVQDARSGLWHEE